jgi:hypothetical protein
VKAPEGDFEIVAAAGEGRCVKEAHHLFDFRLDVGAHGRRRCIVLVHGYTFSRVYVPGFGGWGNVESALRLRR